MSAPKYKYRQRNIYSAASVQYLVCINSEIEQTRGNQNHTQVYRLLANAPDYQAEYEKREQIEPELQTH